MFVRQGLGAKHRSRKKNSKEDGIVYNH